MSVGTIFEWVLIALLILAVIQAWPCVGQTPATAEASSGLPSAILDLKNWKLTLPVSGQDSKHAREIAPADLAAFVHPDFFYPTADKSGVAFRGPCGGTTTSGSGYPRSELREMKDSKTPASWSTDDGQMHVMELTAVITHLPEKKPHVVCAQIHDAKDDVLMVRLERQRLFIERPGQSDVPLVSDYRLGDPVHLKIEVGNGTIRVWCGDRLALTWQTSATGCYFKAGCYTQSNIKKGDRPEAYGEVVIRRLRVTHRPAGS